MAPRGSRARSQLPHASIVWLCLCNAAVGLFVVCYLMSQLGGHGQDVAKASGRVDTMRPRDKAPLQVKRGASVSTSRATLLFGDKRDGADLEDDFANCHSLAMPVGLDGFSVADEDSRTLRYNVTVTDRLVEDGYHFFSVCVVPHKLDQLLTVKLDSLSGDADLYISTTIKHPTAYKATFISASLHTETVHLPSDHPDWDPDTSRVYIGVLGSTNTLYQLSVKVAIKPPPVLYAATKRPRRPRLRAEQPRRAHGDARRV